MKYNYIRHSNRQIHIGLVASCKKGDLHGIIYGFRKPPYLGGEVVFENKIFYFKKESDLEIEKDTLVSYLSCDYDGFSPKVDYVYPISSIIRINDQRDQVRADGICHDDKTWRLINEGTPFFDYSYSRNYCIHYPIIKGDECTIWNGLFGSGIYMNKEAIIYEDYRELSSLKKHACPSLEDIAYAIVQFKDQVASINASEIIDTFVIKKICRYQSRPGRDDNYYEDLRHHLSSEDKYLSYLLPTKTENIFHDDNAYPSDGYKDDIILLEEETQRERERAKEEYSKEKHFAFLLNDFFSKIFEGKNRIVELNKRLKEEFDIKNASEITSCFQGEITDAFLSLINEYNDSTVVGLLSLKDREMRINITHKNV